MEQKHVPYCSDATVLTSGLLWIVNFDADRFFFLYGTLLNVVCRFVGILFLTY